MEDDPQTAIIVAALRLYVLFSVFDGQPRIWSDFLLTKGSLHQLEDDLPFVLSLEGASPECLRELARAFDTLRRIAPSA